MKKVLENMFPVSGGITGSLAPIFTNITWVQFGDMALTAAVFAIVGGIIGYAVKLSLDKICKRN